MGVYVHGMKGVRLWDERCTPMGRKVYAYGMKGVRLWDERCAPMG